jgi:hypothetical protein
MFGSSRSFRSGRGTTPAPRLFSSPPILILLLSLAVAGCGGTVNVKEAFIVSDLSGGWFDAGITEGKNRLVPSVTFRIQKKTNEDVSSPSLNILFKRLVGGKEEEFEDVFMQRVEFTQGNSTDLLTVRPKAGYAGEGQQSRADMLNNSHFEDVRAIIFAKQSSSNWIELARFDLPRQLLTK